MEHTQHIILILKTTPTRGENNLCHIMKPRVETLTKCLCDESAITVTSWLQPDIYSDNNIFILGLSQPGLQAALLPWESSIFFTGFQPDGWNPPGWKCMIIFFFPFSPFFYLCLWNNRSVRLLGPRGILQVRQMRSLAHKCTLHKCTQYNTRFI